ncbi:hypothetical protein RUM43_006918 [Polyplax serrata]|uniref:Erythroid differentiation-related factor 1 n=1 Tax=Polyplax serrata TaxID=468196 RepID=A0AAN8PBV5_POLSC
MKKSNCEDKNVTPQDVTTEKKQKTCDEKEESVIVKKGNDSTGEPEVKSVAVVKYSAVEVPAAFTRLRCNTDLNLPPSNWLSKSVETYGLRPFSFSHRSGFSSFRMANMFPDCVGEVDVVSDAENVKKLLKIPYSRGPVSMMIHRIENTLLIDEFDVHKYLLREAECQWEWFKKFFIENVMKSANSKEKLIHHRDNSRNALQQKSLVSKFLYHSLVVADPSKPTIDKQRESEHVTDTTPLPLAYKNDPPLPDPSMEEESPEPSSNHKFARNVIWTFEDIQMLLGTDMPIFGGGTHPCISLRLRDMTKPINVLTGMDYWLDNLMCNVPEVIMCYHLNGIVQKYELIKTEDLPNLENSKFSPKVIRDIAQNILSFLKANATKAGHTYWLFKGKDDDVVKLYDLTSLCTDVMDEKGQTPFTVPVAMLLYRVARNMKNSSDAAGQAATIRMLLKNCLSLLSAEKYPEIVTSTHYMLSDLYIPSDINPACPEFFTDHGIGPEERSPDEKQNVDESEKDVAIKSMSLANIREIHMDETEFISPAPPLAMDVELRCMDSLDNVLQGLKSLKYLEDKKNVEKTEEPEMAKPFQTIPMPYQSLNAEKDEENKTGQKRKKKKKDSKQADESPKSLLCRSKAEAIPTWRPPTPKNTSSWKTHLKSLLYEKMCLIYATLMEKSYADKKFGLALLYTKLVLIARRVLKSIRLDLSINDVESYLLGRAGDALFMIVQNAQKIETFNKEYREMSAHVQETVEELKNETPDGGLDEEGFPERLKNLEDLLLGSVACYQRAIGVGEAGDNENLLRRLGNIENEVGVFYMNQAAAKYQEEESSQEKEIQCSVYKKLFTKSQLHLQNGIKAFDSVKDEANLALLYSNTGRLMRVQAHFLADSESDDNELATQEKHYYKKSISNYQKALQVLGDRKYNPVIWDSVHWELSTALYAMATRLQDYPCLKNKEEAERELTETLHKALKYCDVDTPGSRQPVYQYRSAMIHHRLASLYHKCYRTRLEDDAKRKKLCQLCKLHYEKSTKLLLQLENSSEYLRVQLERVALTELQAEIVPNTPGKVKYYENALEILLECSGVLQIISERDLRFYDEGDTKVDKTGEDSPEAKTELENELTLLGFFEQRLQFILLSLTKLTMNRSHPKKGCGNISETYKKLYALTLRKNVTQSNPIVVSKWLLKVVLEIAENLETVS